jgi:hypothetical protein
MNPAKLTLVTLAAALVAGGAYAQADDTNSVIAPEPAPSDIHAPPYVDRSYLNEPREHNVQPSPMTPQRADAPYAYPYRNGAPESYFNGSRAARRDANPNDFSAGGVYNPKP